MSAAIEYRFPRTPHLPGSLVIDDDRTLSEAELEVLCRSCEAIVQEKLDGANCSVFFEAGGQPVCQKRAGPIGVRKEKDQYNWFRNWVFKNADGLWQVLGTRRVAFAELVWTTHAVYYDKLPEFVLFFDLLDRQTDLFAPASVVEDVLVPAFAIAPTLWRGKLLWPFDPAREFGRFLAQSEFGRSAPEGVYVRFERDGRLIRRVKYRRPGFRPGSKGTVGRNRLARQSLDQTPRNAM